MWFVARLHMFVFVFVTCVCVLVCDVLCAVVWFVFVVCVWLCVGLFNACACGLRGIFCGVACFLLCLRACEQQCVFYVCDVCVSYCAMLHDV